jgi:4-alpha-glucanotransferase
MSERHAGVLCHITSLPGKYTFGNLGNDAYRFVDFLSNCGFSVWQILPLGPTHCDKSPYLSISAHAGNSLLIDLEWLVSKGWLLQTELKEAYQANLHYHPLCLQTAFNRFLKIADKHTQSDFQQFKIKHEFWLNTYSIFMAIRQHFDEQPWTSWPEAYRDSQSITLDKFATEYKESIEAIQFYQYLFFAQWAELKQYANNKGIYIFGDMPIFVSHDSAEVWGNREYFLLNSTGDAEVVAGVPPDYFSETGQRWGNPHYNWQKLENDGFSWWLERIRTQNELYDALRIDHFRGLAQYWEIPASEETAINGRWVNAPGKHLLQVIKQLFPNLCLIAEDLGTITPDVIELRDEFALPGMKILQFAFDGSSDNPYLPKNHVQNSVVYTATHDNDTTLSWYESLSNEVQNYIKQCINYETDEMPWPMIYATFNSIANMAIVPMQDLLSLGGGNRMNIPGTTDGNWQWRFDWKQVDKNLTSKLSRLLEECNR